MPGDADDTTGRRDLGRGPYSRQVLPHDGDPRRDRHLGPATEMSEHAWDPADTGVVEIGAQEEVPPRGIAQLSVEAAAGGRQEAAMPDGKRRADVVGAEQHVRRPRRPKPGVVMATPSIEQIVVPVDDVKQRVLAREVRNLEERVGRQDITRFDEHDEVAPGLAREQRIELGEPRHPPRSAAR